MSLLVRTLVLFAAISVPVMGKAADIANLPELRNALGLQRLQGRGTPDRPVRVAVLDKAFFGVQKEIGRTLPSNTVYVPGSVDVPDDFKSDHGLRMAQILVGLVSDNARSVPGLELRLYNAFGFTNFQSAIREIVARKTDIVLYSEVWEYGGNLDGRGFINAEVSRATRAGILWINAAGNFARTTYNGSIQTEKENWVRLPDQNKALKLVCSAPQGRKCPAKIVLSWNDFKDDSEDGTNKDLDLALTDDLLNVLQSSALRQSADRKETRPGYSKYPREIVSAELDNGVYYIRVKNSSRNFTDSDRLRVTVDGDFLEMPSAQPQESVLVPADNSKVLTVGASDSERSGFSKRLGKPEVWAPSSVKLTDGNEFRGSSNSAAIVAAAATLMAMNGDRPSKDDIASRGAEFSWDHVGLSTNWLRFRPANGVCFAEGTWDQAPSYVKNVLLMGGHLVQTTAGWRIMIAMDPLVLTGGLQRRAPDDIVAAGTRGWQVFPRGSLVPTDAIEVFQRPVEAGPCDRPSPAQGRLLVF